jgi:hypothetical protein
MVLVVSCYGLLHQRFQVGAPRLRVEQQAVRVSQRSQAAYERFAKGLDDRMRPSVCMASDWTFANAFNRSRCPRRGLAP